MHNVTYTYGTRDGNVILEDIRDPDTRILAVRALNGEGEPNSAFYPQFHDGAGGWFYFQAEYNTPVHTTDLNSAILVTQTHLWRQ